MDKHILSKEQIDEIVGRYIEEKYSQPTINLVREDLEYGLSEEQIDLYKSKKLKYEQKREISNAIRQGVPDEVVSKFSGGKYTESQISTFVEQYKSGMDVEKLVQILVETQSGYDMKEACKKVAEHLSKTKQKDAGAESDKAVPDKVSDKADETDAENDDSIEASAETGNMTVSGGDFLKTMEMMIEGFTNVMQAQFDRMEQRDEEIRRNHSDDGEKILNSRITELEGMLSAVKRELSESYSLVESKDRQIKALNDDLDERKQRYDESVQEIKQLREEVEQMREMSPVSAGNKPAVHPSQNNGVKTDDRTDNDVYKGNYSMNYVTADGKNIPIQVERTERKSPFGISALMSRILPKGTAKTLLTRMIEGRYSGEQLSEIVYAYDNKLAEEEVQELLDANLPAEEMHGIINVVAAAKGGEA